jgi:hypothetical protein
MQIIVINYGTLLDRIEVLSFKIWKWSVFKVRNGDIAQVRISYGYEKACGPYYFAMHTLPRWHVIKTHVRL